MLPVPSTYVKFPPGLIKDFAHLRHARLSVLCSDEAVAGLILQTRKLPHMEQKCAVLAPSAGSVWS